MIAATQDAFHVAPTLAALELGYDVLVEKPVAAEIADVRRIDRRARELGRKVLTCFVLRYTPFYRAVKRVLDSGREAIEIQAAQGGHGGGDQGLVGALYQNITGGNETGLLQNALRGHEIAFAAEAARLA